MSTHRYAVWTRRLHWLIALAVTAALVLIETRGWFERGSALRAGIKWGHMQFGVAVLLLLVPRIAARLRNPRPGISPEPHAWQDALASIVHGTLYLLLLAVPLLGIATMTASGDSWNVLGLPMPVLSLPDEALADDLEGLHEWAGEILMWLAIAHAVAGLLHHFVLRDDTLRRMLPWWRRSG